MIIKYRTIYRMCVDCGEEFAITPEMQEFINEKNLVLPKRCKSCRNDRKAATITKECIDCGEPFQITVNEINFYKERGLHEPRRCPKCRSKHHKDPNPEISTCSGENYSAAITDTTAKS